MCLFIFSWRVMAQSPLIAAANRDEYYQRPSAPATWWADQPNIFAPRDLAANGTWLGFAKTNGGYKFAVITNVRDGSNQQPNAPSRGILVSNYLAGEEDAISYKEALSKVAANYNGFNLLIGEVNPTKQELLWYSNRNASDPRNGQLLAPGMYGISNGALDSHWPKVCKAKAEMASLLCQNAPPEAFFEMLSDTQSAPDHRLPDTGVSLQLERVLSSVCIQTENYGTRSSSLFRISDAFELQYQEKILK